MRGPSGRGASRLARAGVLDSTSSTASKRNEVMAVVSRASPVKVVRYAGQAAAPEARSSCRKELPRMRGRCGRTSFGPGASRARLGRKSGVGMAVRFAVGAKGSHHQKPTPGHCFPAHDCPALRGISRLSCRPVTASLLTSAHNCPELPGSFLLLACSLLRGIARQKNIAPEQVSAHRPPFSVGLTTSAVRKMNPC